MSVACEYPFNADGTIKQVIPTVDPQGQVIGTIDVNNTGGKQQLVEKSCLVSNAVGIRDLYLVFRGQGDNLLTLSSWQFA
ncbi:carbohydrate-binding protein [Bacteroides sp. 51]|uniref:carbohydrate-binding protein n=1 Tax=Bacteroides sp. 51 TaxID=2302938 RepID=UPI00351B1D88